MSNVSRRDFLKGAAAGVAGLTVSGILGACTSTESTSEAAATTAGTTAGTTASTTASAETIPVTAAETESYTYADTISWDAEYDVVVLGMGMSGCTTAITAAEEGASVLIIEKEPEAQAGGNSKVCGQLFAYGNEDYDSTLTYYKQLYGKREIPDAMLETICTGITGLADNIADTFGMDKSEFVDWSDIPIIQKMSPEYPEFEGSDKISLVTTHQGASDSYFYQSVKQNVIDRSDKIDVWYASPAEELIQEPTSKTVIGVKAARKGASVNVRALGGVCVCTGGFEDDAEMVQHYLNIVNYAPLGGLYNTGDGIKMCQKAGADLWHMSSYEGGFGLAGTSYNVPDGSNAIGIQVLSQGPLNTGALILVGTDGYRFVNESETPRHGHLYANGIWENPDFPESIWLIYDQTQSDLIAEENPIPDAYQDTVIECGSMAELAEATGCDEAVLTDTIESFSFCAEQGKDYAFNREAEYMRAFDGVKYYAVPMKSAILNTQGGPKRNENAEILDTNGNPIPHLYSAGEMGGITALMYQGGTNMAECIIFGQIAGRNAAASKDALPLYEKAAAVASTPSTLGEDTDIGASGSSEYEAGDNKYIGTGTGINGDVVVRVTVEDGIITDVEILEHNETEGIGTNAIEQMPESFIGLSSADEIDAVDGVSSATLTSNALRIAVKAALEQAK